MSTTGVALKTKGFGQTRRRDAWWIQPLLVFTVFSSFVVYSTWAAFQGEFYAWGPYLAPFYSPEIFGSSPHALFGPKPGWWPSLIPYSPTFLILWSPLGFRMTCYYYRGAYYKAFWADPPSCSVSEPRNQYRGENTLPLIMQNIHRYFLYSVLIITVYLGHDEWKALWFTDQTTGEVSFGLGVGSIILAINVVLLSGYAFGCHSLRHLIGGNLDLLSKAPIRQASYRCVTCFNKRHMMWAWLSLFWGGFSDIYVRMLAMGIWADWRIF